VVAPPIVAQAPAMDAQAPGSPQGSPVGSPGRGKRERRLTKKKGGRRYHTRRS